MRRGWQAEELCRGQLGQRKAAVGQAAMKENPPAATGARLQGSKTRKDKTCSNFEEQQRASKCQHQQPQQRALLPAVSGSSAAAAQSRLVILRDVLLQSGGQGCEALMAATRVMNVHTFKR